MYVPSVFHASFSPFERAWQAPVQGYHELAVDYNGFTRDASSINLPDSRNILAKRSALSSY